MKNKRGRYNNLDEAENQEEYQQIFLDIRSRYSAEERSERRISKLVYPLISKHPSKMIEMLGSLQAIQLTTTGELRSI